MPKSIFLGLIFVFLTNCAYFQNKSQESVFQETKSFNNFSFEEIWSASLRSIQDIQFIIRSVIKENGFIFAQGKINPNPDYLPPHMNVIIRKEDTWINVICHIALPGQMADFKTKKRYVRRFFEALNKNLNR